VTVTTASPVTVPTSPSGLTLNEDSETQVSLNWIDNSNNETGFEIERSLNGATFSQLSTVGAGVTIYADATISVGNQYSYRVYAFNASGISTASTTASITVTTQGNTVSGAIILPGTGFTGTTAQPAAVGNPTASGYGDNAMARWDVVPYQTFGGNFNVGVVAFDSTGIDHVDFSVNGGAWTSVSTPALNPQSGVVEYWATLRATDFPQDGAIEVRAIAYPNTGVPRVLQGNAGNTLDNASRDGVSSLILNTDAGNTLTQAVRYVSPNGNDSTGDGSQAHPFASINEAAGNFGAQADGGTIYLMPGSYVQQCPDSWNGYAVTNTRWLTITAAPGVTQNQVTITGSANNSRGGDSGLNTKLLCYSNVTITGNITGSWAFTNPGKISAMWFNSVSDVGTDRFASVGVFGINGSKGSNLRFATGCSVNTVDDGFDTWDLVRNCAVNHVAAGFWRNCGLVVNSTGDDIDATGHPEIHSDSLQLSLTVYNTIYYGCQATNGAFIRTTTVVGQTQTDMAMINCTFTGNFPFAWEFGPTTYTNIYVKNTTFNPGFNEYAGFTPVDMVFEGCTFLNSPPIILTGMTIR
jgi:hypothetical protein